MKRSKAAMKASISVALGLLFMGIPCANASDNIGPAETTAISPRNLRLDRCPRPEYPEQELKQNHQGAVTLRFLLGADGTVKRSLVQTSSGYPALDEAALAALSGCRFDPPLVDGRTVEGWTAIHYAFRKPARGYPTILQLMLVLPCLLLAGWLIRSHWIGRASRPGM